MPGDSTTHQHRFHDFSLRCLQQGPVVDTQICAYPLDWSINFDSSIYELRRIINSFN